MKVLIVGGAGYIGGAVTDILAQPRYTYPGVRQAFDEFSRDKKRLILVGSYGLGVVLV